MSLQKVIYTSGKTIISAKNLNDIQDNIILNEKDISCLTSDMSSLESSLRNYKNQLDIALNQIQNLQSQLDTCNEQYQKIAFDHTFFKETVNDFSEKIPSLSKVTVSTTEPENPEIGDIWFNPADEDLLVIGDSFEIESDLISTQGLKKLFNSKLGLTKIWENNAPQYHFPNQTLVCNDMNYQLFLIIFKKNIEESQYKIELGFKDLEIYSVLNNYYRTWIPSEQGIEFKDCSYENILIPYQIFGLLKE